MNKVLIRHLGLQEYGPVYRRMQRFTEQRNEASPDEIWCLQHEPVLTLGLAGKREHILNPGGIPVHNVDRGGQVTYHGPGQAVVYLLMNIKRQGISIKRFVYLLEQSVINFLKAVNLEGVRRQGAPGVYVDDKKIAALGVRVRKGCCYHGLAINIHMDLSPFDGIHPCGYPGLEVTQLSELGVAFSVEEAIEKYLSCLFNQFVYSEVEIINMDNEDSLKSVAA